MSEPSRVRPANVRRTIVIFLALWLALGASRLPLVLTASHGSEITTDEPDLSLMALDRYFGVPMTNTHWPAITNQLLMVPLVGLDFVASGQPRTAGGFAVYAGTQYREPSRLVVLHRWVIVALTSLATAALGMALWRRGRAVAIATVLLLQNAHLITYGTLGLGNGPALAAMIGAAACLLYDGCLRRRSLIAGLLVGVAVSSRNTSVLFVPIGVGFLWALSASRPAFARHLALALAGAIVGSAPAWALALLEPIRWAKSNLGNFVKVGPPVGVRDALDVLLGATGWWTWVVTAAAIAWLVASRRHRAIVIGWLVAFASAVIISARSPLVETRYFDAIVLGAIVLCVLAIVEFLARGGPRTRIAAGSTIDGLSSVDASRHPKRFDRNAVGVVALSGVLAIVGMAGATRRFDASRRGLRPGDRMVAQAIHAPGNGARVIVDRSLLGLLRSRATPASLRALADQTEAAAQRGEALGEFVGRFGLSPEVARVFGQDLTEKEQNEVLRSRAAAAAPPVGEAIDVAAYGDANSARRYGAMGIAEAIAEVRDGRAAEAILRVDTPALIDTRGLRVEAIGGSFVRVRRLGRS